MAELVRGGRDRPVEAAVVDQHPGQRVRVEEVAAGLPAGLRLEPVHAEQDVVAGPVLVALVPPLGADRTHDQCLVAVPERSLAVLEPVAIEVARLLGDRPADVHLGAVGLHGRAVPPRVEVDRAREHVGRRAQAVDRSRNASASTGLQVRAALGLADEREASDPHQRELVHRHVLDGEAVVGSAVRAQQKGAFPQQPATGSGGQSDLCLEGERQRARRRFSQPRLRHGEPNPEGRVAALRLQDPRCRADGRVGPLHGGRAREQLVSQARADRHVERLPRSLARAPAMSTYATATVGLSASSGTPLYRVRVGSGGENELQLKRNSVGVPPPAEWEPRARAALVGVAEHLRAVVRLDGLEQVDAADPEVAVFRASRRARGRWAQHALLGRPREDRGVAERHKPFAGRTGDLHLAEDLPPEVLVQQRVETAGPDLPDRIAGQAPKPRSCHQVFVNVAPADYPLPGAVAAEVGLTLPTWKSKRTVGFVKFPSSGGGGGGGGAGGRTFPPTCM